MYNYPYLFSPIRIGDILFRNRLFAAPAAMAIPEKDGSPNVTNIFYYEDKARGGAASVTVSEACVSAKYAPHLPYSEMELAQPVADQKYSYVKLTSAISRHGAVPAVELFHSGEVTKPQYMRGRNPIGPTAYVRSDGVVVEQMDQALIDETINDFANTAAYMKSVGFRRIMLHGAHGWLLSQFLSSDMNKRKDKYGGSLENRARFSLELIEAVREKVGSGFPIEYSISGDEHIPRGMQLDEAVEFCKLLDGKVDIIHVAAGVYYLSDQYAIPSIYLPHGCNLSMAAAVKKAVKTSFVATVGAYSSISEADRIIRDGDADIVYMCRQIIADPETPNKGRQGREDEIIPCTRCLNCIGSFEEGRRECDVNPITGNELFTQRVIRPIRSPKKVLVVGGGPGGMMAAATAAARGHIVTLAERSDTLGGVLKFTDRDVWKKDLCRYKNYLIHMVKKNSVHLLLNTEVTTALVKMMTPDALIVAIGAHPYLPQIPGVGGKNVMNAYEAYFRDEEIGERIIVVGGGAVGCEVSVHYAKLGKKVTIVERGAELAAQSNYIHRTALFETMEKYHVISHINMTCTSISKSGVHGVDRSNTEHFYPGDTVILAAGLEPNSQDTFELLNCGIDFAVAIGDCDHVGRTKDAVHSGYFTALDIL